MLHMLADVKGTWLEIEQLPPFDTLVVLQCPIMSLACSICFRVGLLSDAGFSIQP